MGQGDMTTISQRFFDGVRLPSLSELDLDTTGAVPDESAKKAPQRASSCKDLIATMRPNEEPRMKNTPSRTKSLKDIFNTATPQIKKVTTLTCVDAIDVPTDLPFRHVLDSPLTPWLTVPYEDLKNKTQDYKAKPQFLDTVQRVASHLGEPQGIVVLGGSCVGVTGWDSIPLAQQAAALSQGTGAFEASAMTYYRLRGRDAVSIMNYLTPRDVSRVKVGTSFFVIFTTPTGTVDDEAVAMRVAEDEFLFSCGGCKQLTFAKEALRRFPDAEMTVSDMVSFNLKGPERLTSMLTLICAEDRNKVQALAECTFTRVRPTWAKENVWVMRSKIGYEMWGSPKVIIGAWDIICTDRKHFTPCAWDILNVYRMECNDMLFTLYPLDLHGGTTLHEVQCGYMINKKSTDWIGKEALAKSKNKKKLELRKLISKSSQALPAQVGAALRSARTGDVIGTITSGAFSLKHGRAVAFAHICADAQDTQFILGAGEEEWELVATKK